jgi:hypothetical protein
VDVLGIVAVVGTGKATSTLEDGQEVTISCAEGDEGYVYDGILEYEENEVDLEVSATDKAPLGPVTLVFAAIGTAGQVVVPITVQQLLDHEVLAPGPIDVPTVVLGGLIAVVALAVAMLASRAAMFRLLRAAAKGLAQEIADETEEFSKIRAKTEKFRPAFRPKLQ